VVGVVSWDAVGHVVRYSRHKGGELLVLILLANHAGSDDWSCWPSINLLAREARLTRRQVQRIVRTLEASGEITTEVGGGRGHATLYFVSRQTSMGATPVSRRKDVALSEGKGDAHVRERAAPMSPESSVEPSLQPLRAETARPRDELFEALAEVEHASLTDLTRSARGNLNAATKQLREIGATAEDVTVRADRYRRLHPTWELTAQALVKHWPSLDGFTVDRPVRTVDQGLDDSWLFPEEAER
jgi:Helix-turn-helix domain